MDRSSPTSSHHHLSRVSLDVGVGSSCSASPLNHTTSAKSSGPHTGLGPQRRGCPRSSPTMLSESLPTFLLCPVRMASPPSVAHHRFVSTEWICGRPSFQSWQSCNSCQPSYASRLSGLPWHRGGVYVSRMFRCCQISVGIWPSHTWDNCTFFTLCRSAWMSLFSYSHVTQVIAWPLQCLRARGISLLAYLDDIVVWHHDRNFLLAQMQQVICFLQDMGFRLNLAKSHPYPSMSMAWLGIHWLPQSGDWHLPVVDQNNIWRMAVELLQAPKITLLQLKWIVGLINFLCQVHR